MTPRPLRIGIIASNLLRIQENVRKGTEIFVYTFAKELKREITENNKDIQVTFFASGDSDVPFPIVSTNKKASSEDEALLSSSHKLAELALFSKAFARKDDFDVFHIHVSNGEWLLPFARVSRIPMVITMHGGANDVYDSTLYSHYNDLNHIHYVSISDYQRKRLPDLPYIRTIYHGIDIRRFAFSEAGGERLMWAGRGIPEKGPDTAVAVFEKTQKPMHLFPITVDAHLAFLSLHLLDKMDMLQQMGDISFQLNLSRKELVPQYQSSKAFLFPLAWEEPFGLVMVESLACGTPVIAFARGSAPEIIRDGVTGFLVNPSEDDIRGKFLIKKTGLDGLCEAVERLYNLSHDEYRTMRTACRTEAEKRFTMERMVNDYLAVYEEVVTKV